MNPESHYMFFTVVWKKTSVKREKNKDYIRVLFELFVCHNKGILEILERQLDMKDRAP